MNLHELADRYWQKANESNPTVATVRGIHDYDDQLPDLTPDGIAGRASEMRSIAEQASGLDDDSLTLQERITKALLIHQATAAADTLDQPFLTASIDPFTGLHTRLFSDSRLSTVRTSEQAFLLIERYSKVPGFLEDAMRLHLQAASEGRTPATAALDRVLSQLDGYLDSPLDDDPFLALEVHERATEWRETATKVVTETVRPAIENYRGALASEIAPVARPDDRCGLNWVEGGDEIYENLIGKYTQLDMEPSEIHEIGLTWATGINAEEWVAIGGPALGATSREEVFEILHNDPDLRFTSEEEMLGHARSALDRAWSVVGDWFGAMPETPCQVLPVPAAVAPAMPPAYYNQPPVDGSRPGTYFLNTYQPEDRDLFEYESIHFHEGIPGHHFDRSLAAELDGIPMFRRYAQVYAHTEGWGLYSERLADEMGLYSGPTDRLGMVSADAWRAGRLVTDTGIHALGWSRDQAIDFLATWTPISRLTIEQEVDRYIGMPGQALSYKMGQLEISRLRRQAARELGGRFDVKGFHDTILVNGAMPLPMLAEAVGEWTSTV